MRTRRFGSSLAAAMLLGPAAAIAAHAAGMEAYPARPVRVLVPQTPGSSADFFARVVSERLREKWSVPVVVDNRAGAGGAISMELVKQAIPDGYTLTLTTEGTLAIMPHLYPNLHYNALTDFAPITRVASAPYVLIVNPALPAKSVKELIALAKSRPGQINFASGGNGTGTHLSGELFKSLAGINIVHVPYKGASLGLNDVVGGQVQMMFTGVPTALAQVRAGRLRALGVTTTRRAPVLPEVPTVSEAGLEGYEVAPWWGVLSGAGTPRAVIEKIHADIVQALKEDALRQQLASQGAEAVGDTPAQFATALKAEFAKWARVIKDARVQVQ